MYQEMTIGRFIEHIAKRQGLNESPQILAIIGEFGGILIEEEVLPCANKEEGEKTCRTYEFGDESTFMLVITVIEEIPDISDQDLADHWG